MNNPYCTYANINTDSYSWSIGSASTLTPNTGPSNDHTTGGPKGIKAIYRLLVTVYKLVVS